MQSSELILLRTYCAPVPHRELLQNELEDFVRQPDEGVSAAASRPGAALAASAWPSASCAAASPGPPGAPAVASAALPRRPGASVS